MAALIRCALFLPLFHPSAGFSCMIHNQGTFVRPEDWGPSLCDCLAAFQPFTSDHLLSASTAKLPCVSVTHDAKLDRGC